MRPAVLLGFVRGIEAMAGALLEHSDLEIITLYDPSSELLRRRGIEHRNLSDFVTDPMRERALERAQQRARIIADAFHGQRMAAEYPHFTPPAWAGLGAEVNTLMRRDLVEQILLIDLLRRCACEMDLRLLVVHEDITRDTKTAIMGAHRLGIPALHILHGFPYGTTNAHNVVTADVIAAYSERAKAIYVGFGAAPGRVVVTGNPFWDVYARPPLPGFKEEVCQKMGLDPHRPIIHCALTNIHRFSTVSVRHPLYHIETTELILDAFAELSRKYPDWQFLMRPHPSDHSPVEHLKRRAAEAGLDSLKVDKTYAYDSVVLADALVCTHSNMGVEAILQGKPVVNVAIDELAGPVFREGMGPLFLEDDAVLWARTPDEIAPQIEAAVVDPATRERLLELRPASIERFNHANDGRAMQRVCALVADMLKEPHAFVAPVERFPEFERPLAEALPNDAKSILVLGRAAFYTADRIADLHPNAAVTTSRQIPDPLPDHTALPDAVVMADPLPHSPEAQRLLRDATRCLHEDGVLIAPFEHGATEENLAAYSECRWIPPRQVADAPYILDGYCWNGVELVLSRCDLEPAAAIAVEGLLPSNPAPEIAPILDATRGPYDGDRELQGWVVTARRRPQRLGEFGESLAHKRRQAERANRRGEARFTQGDIHGAINDFAAAVNECNEVGLYFSNLATALHAAGKPEQAWDRLMDAIHLDPGNPAIRENLRAIAQTTNRQQEADNILATFGSES